MHELLLLDELKIHDMLFDTEKLFRVMVDDEVDDIIDDLLPVQVMLQHDEDLLIFEVLNMEELLLEIDQCHLQQICLELKMVILVIDMLELHGKMGHQKKY